MAAGPSIDVTGWLQEQLAQASPDLLRSMVQTFAEALMGAEADAVCGAGYGERSDYRTNTRNGYRRREWNTRAGTIDLAIPKLRAGSYFPDSENRGCGLAGPRLTRSLTDRGVLSQIRRRGRPARTCARWRRRDLIGA
jgi:Transposase, Mutator family